MRGEDLIKSVTALSVSGDAVSHWTPTLHTTLVFAVCTAAPCEGNPPLAGCKASFKTGFDWPIFVCIGVCGCVRLRPCWCFVRGHIRGAEKARGPRGPWRFFVLCHIFTIGPFWRGFAKPVKRLHSRRADEALPLWKLNFYPLTLSSTAAPPPTRL